MKAIPYKICILQTFSNLGQFVWISQGRKCFFFLFLFCFGFLLAREPSPHLDERRGDFGFVLNPEISTMSS